MDTCFKCGKAVDEQHNMLFGIMKKEHIDTRHDTADIAAGVTTYQALALIRVGICDNCRRELRIKARRDAFKWMGGGAALLLAAAGVAAWISTEAGGVIAVFGAIMLLRGVFDLVSTFSPHDKSSLLSKAFNGSVDPAWLVHPKQEQPLSVKDVEPNIGRYHCLHSYYNEAVLKKPIKGKGKAGSKLAALDTLRAWAQDPSIKNGY